MSNTTSDNDDTRRIERRRAALEAFGASTARGCPAAITPSIA